MSESMFNTYQEMTRETAVYPDCRERTEAALNYCLMGLGGEVGELQNKFKKILRGDKLPDTTFAIEVALELGDALWYLARAADEIGYSLHDVAQMNMDKLYRRKQEKTLQGDGDNR